MPINVHDLLGSIGYISHHSGLTIIIWVSFVYLSQKVLPKAPNFQEKLNNIFINDTLHLVFNMAGSHDRLYVLIRL